MAKQSKTPPPKKNAWTWIKENAVIIGVVTITSGALLGVGKLSNIREDILVIDGKVDKYRELLELNRIESGKSVTRIDALEKRIEKIE